MTSRNGRKMQELSGVPSLGRRIAAGAITAALGLSMSVPYGAVEALAEEATTGPSDASSQDGSASQSAKNEIVYTKTDASGASQGVYVVNSFDTTDAVDVSDPGTYTSVKNLSTSQQLTNADGSVQLTTTADKPFYYQGDLDSTTALPWKVSLTYTLDGKRVSPDDLAGKSGRLDIELKVEGADDDSATADFAKSFLLQAQGTFPKANFRLDEAQDATTAEVGSNTLVTYLVLPGSDGDYHITGDAQDFTYDGWQISAMPLSLAIDVNDYDTSELTDATSELESGVGKLNDGGKSLAAALGLINDGAGSASEGSASLEDLRALAEKGAEILTCGTCLNYYGLAEKLAVGGVTNMYAIVETLANAGKVIKP